LRLTVNFSDPDTNGLVDPASATLDLLMRDSMVILTPDSNALTRLSQGIFRYVLDTSGFIGGRYDWRIRGVDQSGDVSLIEDYFILTDPATNNPAT
jgi:hypothetical protein